jgi:hypothetical protein
VQADALATLGVLPSLSAEEAYQALQKAVDLAETACLLEIALRAHHNLAGSVKEYKGDLPSAHLHYLRAVEIGRKRGVASEELISLLGATGVSFNLGDLAEVEKNLAYMDRLANTMANLDIYKISINGIKASYKWLLGEWDESLNLLRGCLTDSLQRGDLQGVSNAAIELVWNLLELHQWAELIDWSEADSAFCAG